MLMWRFVFPVVAVVVVGYVFAREEAANDLCKERAIKPPALKPGFGMLGCVALPVFFIYGLVLFRWYVALGLAVGGFFAMIGVAALLDAVAGPWLRRRAIAALAGAGVDIRGIPPAAPPEPASAAGAAAAPVAAGGGGSGGHVEEAGATPEGRPWHSRSPIAALKAVKDRVIALLQADAAPPSPPSVAPEHRVLRAGEDEWQVLCQVCGALAMRFTVGAQRVMGVTLDEAPHVVYEGLTKRTTFELDRKERAWALLGADDLKGLHALVSDLGQFDGGLDAYCPKCDKVYCRSHYATAETWDEGFYDCTYGTCPKGHRRIIDD